MSNVININNAISDLRAARAERAIIKFPQEAAMHLYDELCVWQLYMESYLNRKSLRNADFHKSDFDVEPEEFIRRMAAGIKPIVEDLNKIYEI